MFAATTWRCRPFVRLAPGGTRVCVVACQQGYEVRSWLRRSGARERATAARGRRRGRGRQLFFSPLICASFKSKCPRDKEEDTDICCNRIYLEEDRRNIVFIDPFVTRMLPSRYFSAKEWWLQPPLHDHTRKRILLQSGFICFVVLFVSMYAFF